MVRVGRLGALTNPDDGVRGIVAGDVVRRFVSRTGTVTAFINMFCQPRQALIASPTCCSRLLIEGISAHDLISREAMLQGLARLEEGRWSICGRMSLAQPTKFRKGKAESKEMRGCRCFSVLDSTRPSVPVRNDGLLAHDALAASAGLPLSVSGSWHV